jgi:hypothetical protein
VFKTGAHSGAGEATIPLSVRAAVNNGLFSSQKPDASFNCRTGNCTYASEYSSVAYCSACSDATNQLNFTQYSQYDEVINRTFPYTNVSLSVDRGRSLVLSHGGPSMSLGYVNLISYAGSNADIAMIRWNGVNAVPGNTETIRGYRCSLYPCIKTFRANVTTGKLKEEVVNEATNVFSWTGSVGSTADLNCLDNPDQRRTLTQLGYKLNDTMRWLPYNVSMINGTTQNPVYQQSPNSNPCKTAPANQYNDLCNGGKMTTKAIEVVPARCIYAMGVITVSSLNMNLFYQMFTGIIRGSWGYGHAGYDGAEALTALFNAGSGNGTLEDLDGVLKNMTGTLTTYMRQAGQRGFSEPAVGKMYGYTSCIQIRWAWLSYAAAVVGLLLIFFVWMVVHSRTNQSQLRKQWTSEGAAPPVHDFKSSALSTLFHGLDRESLVHMDDTGASNQDSELRRKAERVGVRLVATEQGWKLSSTDL